MSEPKETLSGGKSAFKDGDKWYDNMGGSHLTKKAADFAIQSGIFAAEKAGRNTLTKLDGFVLVGVFFLYLFFCGGVVIYWRMDRHFTSFAIVLAASALAYVIYKFLYKTMPSFRLKIYAVIFFGWIAIKFILMKMLGISF